MQGIVEKGAVGDISGAVIFGAEPSDVDVFGGGVGGFPFIIGGEKIPPCLEGGFPAVAFFEQSFGGPGDAAVDGWKGDGIVSTTICDKRLEDLGWLGERTVGRVEYALDVVEGCAEMDLGGVEPHDCFLGAGGLD